MTFDVDASVGIALYPDHAPDFEMLLQRADVAMYLAKEGRTGVEIYDAGQGPQHARAAQPPRRPAPRHRHRRARAALPAQGRPGRRRRCRAWRRCCAGATRTAG